MPQPFPRFMCLPPIRKVVQVHTVEVILVLSPKFRRQRFNLVFFYAITVSPWISDRVRCNPRYMALRRKRLLWAIALPVWIKGLRLFFNFFLRLNNVRLSCQVRSLNPPSTSLRANVFDVGFLIFLAVKQRLQKFLTFCRLRCSENLQLLHLLVNKRCDHQ